MRRSTKRGKIVGAVGNAAAVCRKGLLWKTRWALSR